MSLAGCGVASSFQPQPHLPHVFEHQDHLAELNGCLEATAKGMEASLDIAKERTTHHRESILGVKEASTSWVSDHPSIPCISSLLLGSAAWPRAHHQERKAGIGGRREKWSWK